MARRNPKAELPLGVFEEAFSVGKLDVNLWRATTETGSTDGAGNTPSFTPANANLSHGMLALKLQQEEAGAGIVSTGAQVKSKRRFGYGTYEFAIRASSIAHDPTEPATAINGAVTSIFLEYDAGVDGYIKIGFQAEGLWQRADNWQIVCYDSNNSPPTVVVPANKPGSDFYNLKFVWTPERVQFFINNKLVHTLEESLVPLTGQIVFSHSGTNDPDWGGLAATSDIYDRTVFISYFRYADASTNLARNPSFEVQQTERPYWYYPFLIDATGVVPTTWTAPAGRSGLAAGLRAGGAVPYIEYSAGPPEVLPSRFGIRTAPWEDPDHRTIETRTGIRVHWKPDVDYIVSFYAKKVNGAAWTKMGLSWASPPNIRSGAGTEPELLNPNLTTSWQRYAFHFKWSNPVEQYGNLFINVVGDTVLNDEIHIDDLYVGVGTEVTPFVRDAADVIVPFVPEPPAAPSSRLVGCYFTCWDTTYNITEVPEDFNLIYLFHAEPVGGPSGDGTFVFPYYPNVDTEDIQYCRARGQRVVLTVGGANAGLFFNTRAKSQKFVDSFKLMYANLGGVDGCDFNNFEQFTQVHGSGANATLMGNEMAWIAQELKDEYGTDFSISMPPHPGGGYAPADRVIADVMNDAGVLAWAGPQFYDAPDLTQYNTIYSLINEWIDHLGDASKVMVGLSANYGLGPTLNTCISVWNALVAEHPDLRGVFCWSAQTNLAGGNTWGSTMRDLMPVDDAPEIRWLDPIDYTDNDPELGNPTSTIVEI